MSLVVVVARDQPVGRAVEPPARVVTRLAGRAARSSSALIAFGAAWLALLPGVGFWDTAELQAVGPLMGTAHPTGFPTYVLLGWLASVILQPLGEPAFRMNLLSAICVAVAAGVTVDLVRALTGSVVLGVMAGLGLALTPIAWGMATHAEAHTLHLALVAILLRLLVAWDARVRPADSGERTDRGDRFLVAAAVVFGLVARQPFADAPPGRPGRPVRPRRGPEDLAPGPARRWPASRPSR